MRQKRRKRDRRPEKRHRKEERQQDRQRGDRDRERSRERGAGTGNYIRRPSSTSASDRGVACHQEMTTAATVSAQSVLGQTITGNWRLGDQLARSNAHYGYGFTARQEPYVLLATTHTPVPAFTR